MSGTELSIVLAAVIVGSLIKAVTGMGLPLVAIPIATLFVDVDAAVVVLAFPNLLSNAVLAWRERGHRSDTRDLPVLVVTGIVGAVVGAVAFVSLPETPLLLLLIISILGYVVTFFARPDLVVGPERSRRLAPVVGTVAGAFQGAIGISGPVVGSWIHSYRLPRSAHILSVTTIFLVSGTAQFVVLVLSGELGGRVGASALAIVPVLVVIPVGTRLRDRASSRTFDLAVVGMLLASAVALAVKIVL